MEENSIEVVKSTECRCGAVVPGAPDTCPECGQSLVVYWKGRTYKSIEELEAEMQQNEG